MWCHFLSFWSSSLAATLPVKFWSQCKQTSSQGDFCWFSSCLCWYWCHFYQSVICNVNQCVKMAAHSDDLLRWHCLDLSHLKSLIAVIKRNHLIVSSSPPCKHVPLIMRGWVIITVLLSKNLIWTNREQYWNIIYYTFLVNHSSHPWSNFAFPKKSILLTL